MYFSLETAFFQSNEVPFLDEIFVGTQNSNFITNLKMADQKQRNHLTLEVKNFIVQQKLQRPKKKPEIPYK